MTASPHAPAPDLHVHGLRANRAQFLHQLAQVFLVGLTIGMLRTVVPALAESDFGVPQGSFLLLTAFVVAFGAVKATLNFVAGWLSERLGRKAVLLLGWAAAVPIPAMILYAPNWNWIVAATVLLGINQGLAWSMTQTAKMDLADHDERGFAMGLNAFGGYVGVAVAGIVTGALAAAYGPRVGLFVFGVAAIGAALLLTVFGVRETIAWARAETARHAAGRGNGPRARFPAGVAAEATTWQVFAVMSWRDRRLVAFNQAGLVEKFVDALVWAFYPVFLYQAGLSLTQIGWVVGVYGFVWGGGQLFTGRLSDRVGRRWPIVSGMWIAGLGVALTVLADGLAGWTAAAALTGLGMALLYPNLGAAVADISHPAWRGTAIGIYRFWRDLGYAVGALALGLAAQGSGSMAVGFWLVAGAMLLSGGLVWLWGEETHPRLNPAEPAADVIPEAN